MRELDRITPEEAGFVPDLNERLDQLVADRKIWNLHGVLISRAGRIVLERYFQGIDYAYSRPLGEVSFDPDTLHDIRSVTKSVIALLYGIALHAGQVPGPEQPLMAAFPEYADLLTEERGRLTIAHALTMSMGIEWDEFGLAYTDTRNSEIAMEWAPERYRYVLERKVVAAPGQRWAYCGGATALLGRIIVKGTGLSLPEFAKRALFDPLGIGRTEWMIGGSDRSASAASGLRMTLPDLGLIGQLVAQGGCFGGRQVVPASWMSEMLTPRVSADEMRRYGYHWWLGDFAFGIPPRTRLERHASAFGNGGQRLFVIPALDLVVAIFAGNYSADDQWIPPTEVLRHLVLAGFQELP